MTPSDGDLLEEILLQLATHRRGPLRVLEWGSGLSTLHYPAWLIERNRPVAWLSIEHHREFFRAALEPALRTSGARIVWSEDIPTSRSVWQRSHVGVTAVVFDKGPINPLDRSPTRYEDRAKDLDDYVSFPSQCDLRFDLVLVDGRKRRRCVLAAASLLDASGVVLLHDAQRPYYHCALSTFPSSRRIGDELWIGAVESMSFEDVVPPQGRTARGLQYVPGQ
jgi:hypothetical protein